MREARSPNHRQRRLLLRPTDREGNGLPETGSHPCTLPCPRGFPGFGPGLRPVKDGNNIFGFATRGSSPAVLVCDSVDAGTGCGSPRNPPHSVTGSPETLDDLMVEHDGSSIWKFGGATHGSGALDQTPKTNASGKMFPCPNAWVTTSRGQNCCPQNILNRSRPRSE